MHNRAPDWWDNGDGLKDLIWRVRRRPWFPYPLRSTRISIDIVPFSFWLLPEFKHKKNLSESARRDGVTIWWLR